MDFKNKIPEFFERHDRKNVSEQTRNFFFWTENSKSSELYLRFILANLHSQ